jgi:voltage-gated potassium channel Kch
LVSFRDSRRVRWFFWRGLALVAVFVAGLVAFELGVDVTDRRGIADAGLLTHIYYTLGLFVLGGMDLGVPTGGSGLARGLLWFAYFAAPTITASAVIEGVLRAVDPERWRLRRMTHHVVLGGGGKLGALYLERLRQNHAHTPVVVVESNPPYARAMHDVYGAHVVRGDISSQTILDSVRLAQARRILLLTGDDFVNLDAATRILQLDPSAGKRMIVHVSDLRFKRFTKHTRVSKECTTFNSYQVAARHLFETQLLAHFARTDARDIVVLVGFGRLGQTILTELQQRSPESLDTVIIIDLHAEERACDFGEQIGFSDSYVHSVFDGSADDARLWQRIEAQHDLRTSPPVFVLGSGDDGMNLRIAMRLTNRYPEALVLGRTYARSAFAEEVSEDANVHIFSIADLILRSMPSEWFD